MPPIQQQRSTEHLAQFCTHERREALGHVVPIFGALRSDAYFHELVLLERCIDGRDDSIAEAVFSKLNERIEVMPERSQVSSLFSRQAHGHSRDAV